MSNFVNVPADLSCKLFDTLIRPILLYNSEVWFMENYLSIYKSVNRSRSHGTICDTLSLGDKFCFEKIHHRDCKTILGIRKKKEKKQKKLLVIWQQRMSWDDSL